MLKQRLHCDQNIAELWQKIEHDSANIKDVIERNLGIFYIASIFYGFDYIQDWSFWYDYKYINKFVSFFLST